MSEHFGHFILPLSVIIFTALFVFRAYFKPSLLIIGLLLIVILNGLFLHINHQVFDKLSESTHQCCILPVAITFELFVFGLVVLKLVELEIIILNRLFKTYSYSFYSRPPPF